MRFLTYLIALLLLPTLAGSQSQESSTSSSLPYDWKSNCRLATAAALPAVNATSTKLTAAAFGALTVDGIAVAANDRVLVKDQTIPAQNGIYRVSVPGTGSSLFLLSRDSDGNEWRDFPGSIVAITSEGTANKNTSWRCTAATTGVVGTNDIPYTNASGGGGGTTPTGAPGATSVTPISTYTLRQSTNRLLGFPGDTGLSGASYNGRAGTLFLVQNVTGAAGLTNEFSVDGRLLRTITHSGFIDTEAVKWVGWDAVNNCDVVLIAEENGTVPNDQRISLCRLTPGAVGLTRGTAGNASTTTAYSNGNIANNGLECLCYDSVRSVIYYTVEFQTAAGSDNTQGTANAKIFTRPITWTTGVYTFGAETVLCNINALFPGTVTDLSDMEYDPVSDTILLLSHQSLKVVRISRAGVVLEQFTGLTLTQPEGLTLSTDGRTMWVAGEGTGVSDLYRFAVGPDIESTSGVAWGGGLGVAADTYLGRKGVRTVQAGGSPTLAPGAYTLQVGEDTRAGVDTNLAGASGTLRPGNGTGTSTPTSLIIETPTVGTTGTAAQAYATRVTINSTAMTVVPPITATNIALFPGTTTYAATTNLDFSLNSLTTLALAGNVIFTTSNLNNGRSMTVRILCDGTARNFTFPGTWTFIGAAPPGTIAANKTGILTLTSFTAVDAGVVASYAVQP